jgi:hypothetical protein
MFKLPEMPSINLPTFDLPKIDFSAIKFPTVDFPSIDFPSIDFSRLDISALRDVDFAKYVTDAAYITVGLGVVAVEKAQARRQQLVATVTEFTKVARDQVRGLIHTAA